MENEKKEEFLTIKDLAARWKTSVLYVHRVRDKNKNFPPAYRIMSGKGKMYFKMSEIESYENSKKV